MRYSALLLLAMACTAAPRHEGPAFGLPAIGVRPDSFLTIRERIEFKDQNLWRAQLGRVAIIARSTEDPTKNIGNARARLRPLNDTSRVLRQLTVPLDGVRLDSLPLDGYLLEVGVPFVLNQDTARLWSRVDVPLQVRRGCTAYVEVYLRTTYRICEDGACPMPREHAMLTMCREA